MNYLVTPSTPGWVGRDAILAPQGLASRALKESHILRDRADDQPVMALEAADMKESSLGRKTQVHSE